ncbi:MAG: NAD-dependent epimerase/dehydratase family protein [Alphaproteobacteria bacterium]|nr:NAD-dependent epimerase/dehydratase family protein [Alphaproteobacteria bacterium]
MALYLVTGGLGFIGSHVAEALVARGERVRIIDDLSTGKRENAPSGAEVVIGDVADPPTVFKAAQGCEGIFHLAAVASVEKGHTDWLGTHRINLTGTIAVFEAAKRARPGRPPAVVFASSAAVYGDNPDMPLKETSTAKPLSAYGADKLGCELHARVAALVHGVPATGFRFFNVFGPRQDPKSPYSGVIAIFAGRIKDGQALTVNGDGQQTRDFVYVGDVVRALLAAMDRPNLQAEVFNVCTGRAISIVELATAIAELAGKTVDIRHGPARVGDIRHSIGDPGRLEAAFGLKAATTLREGLAKTLQWA